MKTTVSIIMPVYNAEKYVREAIDSVLNQSFCDIELIVIDDCSSDGTEDILKCIDDSRVKVITHSLNTGVSKTRNEGIELASGEYIIFMDDDDLMPVERVKGHVEFLDAHPDIDAVGGKVFDIDSNGTVTGIWNPVVVNNPRYICAKLLQCGVFINGAVTYRKKTLVDNKIFFSDNAYGLEDYDIMVRVSKVGKISGVDIPVLLYRRHLSNTEKNIKKSMLLERRKSWRRIYKYAYSADGFILTDEDYDVLLEVFDENRTEKPSHELLGRFLLVLADLERQINELNPDNREELMIWMNQCRKNLC